MNLGSRPTEDNSSKVEKRSHGRWPGPCLLHRRKNFYLNLTEPLRISSPLSIILLYSVRDLVVKNLLLFFLHYSRKLGSSVSLGGNPVWPEESWSRAQVRPFYERRSSDLHRHFGLSAFFVDVRRLSSLMPFLQKTWGPYVSVVGLCNLIVEIWFFVLRSPQVQRRDLRPLVVVSPSLRRTLVTFLALKISVCLDRDQAEKEEPWMEWSGSSKEIEEGIERKRRIVNNGSLYNIQLKVETNERHRRIPSSLNSWSWSKTSDDVKVRRSYQGTKSSQNHLQTRFNNVIH